MKKKALLPAITLFVLLSTTFLATAYRNSHVQHDTVKEMKLAKEEEDDSDFDGGLRGEFIWESLTRHLHFVKY
jgi:hypothetical protein